jgi:probable phosphoglycerate mutase
MVVIVYLIRHCKTKANEEGRKQGSELDLDLSGEGILQAIQLRQKMEDKRIDVVYSPPATRAKQTTETIFGLKYETDERLKDRNLGEWTGKTKDYLKDNYPEEYKKYKKNRDMSNVKGAESYKQMEKRVKEFFKHLLSIHNNRVVVIVGHSHFLKIALVLINSLTREEIDDVNLPNSGIVKVKFFGKDIGTGKVLEEI